MGISSLRIEVENKIKTWANSKNPVIPISYESVPFTKPDTTWIEVFIIPAMTDNTTLSTQRKTLKGIIQINLYTKDGVGTKLSETLAEEIINILPATTKSSNLSIEKTGYIMSPVKDAQWRVTPIRFEYRQESY